MRQWFTISLSGQFQSVYSTTFSHVGQSISA